MNHSKVAEPIKKKIGNRPRLLCPIADCQDVKATQQGYATRQGYERHFRLYHVQSETIGLMSRIDWGSPGFRAGLLKRAFEQFRAENVRFVILAGGLVSFPHLRKKLTARALDELWHDLWGASYEEEKKPPRSARVESARDYLVESWAKELAQAIPRYKNGSGRLLRIYLVTSSATNYDGPLGSELAHLLVRYRPDIRFWGDVSARIPLKHQNKVLLVLTPRKAVWRSKYFSTAVDRLIEDEENRTSQALPDLWVVGCTASSLQRPQGEKKRPYISVPALHRLGEVHIAENQIGVRVVEFTPDSRDLLVRTYNYKDYTAREREFIPVPKQANGIQQKVVAILKAKGPHTIGMLEDALRINRGQIAAEIAALNKSHYRPQIEFNTDSQLYDFDPKWIQNQLTYPSLPIESAREDNLLAFACLHAGSTYSEYKFFVNEVPELMLRRGSTILVGAGDLIQGLEHDLDRRGEVMPGFNSYTDQETLAARLVCETMTRVLEKRLDRALQAIPNRRPSATKLAKIVEAALPTFLWREGNHDAWVLRRGHAPLATFSRDLVSYLAQSLWIALEKRGLTLPNLSGIANSHVRFGEVHQLPSGLGLTILHPHMPRTLTSSLRAQHMLDMAGTPLVIGANFHVGVIVERWEPHHGQRLATQVGALVWQTEFEHSRLKTLDVGVATIRILSHEGRILMTETTFFGEGTEGKEYGREEVLPNFLKTIGI